MDKKLLWGPVGRGAKALSWLTSHIEHHWRWILPDGVTGILCGISARSVMDEVHAFLDNVYILCNLRKRVAELDMDAGNILIMNQLEKIV